jgi:MoxR-like ATPases
MNIDPETEKRAFRFYKGPIFANIVLADEINRTPPKTQAALLEAMQEHRVTAGGHTYDIDEPFFVLATQNPIEQEGTYPLPEAQLDRFMFHLNINYPSIDEEVSIVNETTVGKKHTVNKVFSKESIIGFQDLVFRVPISDNVVNYAVKLASSTRPNENTGSEYVKKWVEWGAGPRASQYLVLGAKAKALLDGRPTPSIEDIQSLAPEILRHRILPNFNAEAEGITADDIVNQLIQNLED